MLKYPSNFKACNVHFLIRGWKAASVKSVCFSDVQKVLSQMGAFLGLRSTWMLVSDVKHFSFRLNSLSKKYIKGHTAYILWIQRILSCTSPTLLSWFLLWYITYSHQKRHKCIAGLYCCVWFPNGTINCFCDINTLFILCFAFECYLC